MLAKEQIRQCFNCKNIVDCWGIFRDFSTEPVNPKDLKLVGVDFENMEFSTVHDFYATVSLAYISAVTPEVSVETRGDILQTIIAVAEALTNSSNAEWECPPDWAYEPEESVEW